MNNLLSYYGLVDAKIRASDKDLPIPENSINWEGSQVALASPRNLGLLKKVTNECGDNL